MVRALLAAMILASILAGTAAVAAQRTVTLAVDGMTCASCPYIVKQSLSRVPGVERVEVSYADKRAVVTFDDSKTDVAALTKATASVGFPSELAE
ncbi:MAG: mercuric transport protein periplasmic component [Parvibaculum sp.]|jgi:mercuric ion binding protein|uniref:mercury resistance system periplasmic binding protein MerP n=1 Tax=Parvibaculum sp. TaxID=2024848 RepID=UPI000C54B5A7|nr:mercury resistance system periplasmic binding protein MerP [Parvibaculum sp.]MAC40124.1 mercuric transport protein periplasmic component [Oceanicaulis sp.]MAU62705.1 mercuric transport protein periplasmic component [Parvibaculum sp.]|tara:strand:+ start:101 stop:385 length:285 start_codon:yes stop_codon:yes gene_type:complete